MKEAKIFDYLVGKWLISRKLDNIGFAEGKGSFIKETTCKIKYNEDLLITFNNGRVIKAYREYEYLYINNKILKIFFDLAGNNKLTYYLKFNRDYSIAKGQYKCNQDIYEAYYKFFHGNFILSYNIIGPNKNYYIENIYKKIII